MPFGDLGGDRLQPRLVAVGQRQIAAARREFKRQRPADAAGSTGDGGGGSTDRGHSMSAPLSAAPNQKAGLRPAVLGKSSRPLLEGPGGAGLHPGLKSLLGLLGLLCLLRLFRLLRFLSHSILIWV